MFQFLCATSPEHNFIDCGAFNPFLVTSSDFLSGLEKSVILKPCNRHPKWFRKTPKSLRIYPCSGTSCSCLYAQSYMQTCFRWVHNLVFCVTHWPLNETQKIEVGSWCQVWGGAWVSKRGVWSFMERLIPQSAWVPAPRRGEPSTCLSLRPCNISSRKAPACGREWARVTISCYKQETVR